MATPHILHHTEVGDPDHPAVLFLHGFMGSSADWKAVVADLASQYRCVTVDLPGHGASTGLPDEAFSIDATAQALIEVLDHLVIDQSTVVGYSMGGRLALYVALHHPERCTKLLLESASPGLVTEAEREARRGVDEARAVRLETDDFEEFLHDWYGQALFSSLAQHPEAAQRMLAARRQNDPRELARSLRGIGTGQQPSLWERLAGLRVSTWAVAGALDGPYVEIAERMAVHSPRVRSVVVPDAGHTIHAEQPQHFVALLRDCLHQPT